MRILPFFQALFGAYSDPALRLEIRPLLPERERAAKTEAEVRKIHAFVRNWFPLAPDTLEAASNYAVNLADRFDLYFGVLPRLGRAGGKNDVPSAQTLFCDVDGGEDGPQSAIDLLKRAELPRPHVAVQSGGGAHAYWFLADPVALPDAESRERMKSLLRRVALAIGGQKPGPAAEVKAGEVARILRVPGTWNHKSVPPKPVKLLRLEPDAERLSSAYWSLYLLPEEKLEVKDLPKRHTRPYTAAGLVTEGLLNWAKRQVYPEGERHNHLVSDARWLVHDCRLSPEDARCLLEIISRQSPGRHAITDRELRGMF